MTGDIDHIASYFTLTEHDYHQLLDTINIDIITEISEKNEILVPTKVTIMSKNDNHFPRD